MRTIRDGTKAAWLLTPLAWLAVPAAFAQTLDSQLKPVVDEIVSSCTQAGVKRITVADFTDLQAQATDLGRFVAEELGVSLVMAKPKFGLVDRANLRTILAEHKLTMSGLVNPDTAKKLGQIAGVDGIVTGTITPLGETYRLTVKVIATDTASIISAARSDIARTPALIDVDKPGTRRSALPEPEAAPKKGDTEALSVLPRSMKIVAAPVGRGGGLAHFDARPSSQDWRVGDDCGGSFVLMERVVVDGKPIAAKGAKVNCRVTNVSGHQIGLQLTSLETDDGRTLPIKTETLRLERRFFLGFTGTFRVE